MNVNRLIRQYALLPWICISLAGLPLVSLGAEDTIRYLVVQGDIEDAQRTDVTNAVLALEGALSNIDQVRNHLTAIDWIANAEVQFNWPDELTVNVFPERAIAYWNDSGFINKEGTTFRSLYHAGEDLPHLFGPDDQVQAVLDRYLEIRRAVLDRAIETVEVRDRGAVAFELRSGWQVLLGSADISQRLQRAVVVMHRLEAMGVDPEHTRIDARYTDGVAINESVPTIEVLMSQHGNSIKGNEL